jgi:hypothetical protein
MRPIHRPMSVPCRVALICIDMYILVSCSISSSVGHIRTYSCGPFIDLCLYLVELPWYALICTYLSAVPFPPQLGNKDQTRSMSVYSLSEHTSFSCVFYLNRRFLNWDLARIRIVRDGLIIWKLYDRCIYNYNNGVASDLKFPSLAPPVGGGP